MIRKAPGGSTASGSGAGACPPGPGPDLPGPGSDVAPKEEAQGQSEDGAEGNENGKGLRHEAEGDYLHPSSGQKELPCRQIKGRHAADGHRADTHGDKGAQA